MNMNKGISRRSFLRKSAQTIGLLKAGAILASCNTISKTTDEVRLGYLPITDAAPLLVAHANHFFEDEGLKARTPLLIRNWSALIEGFAAGKFNVAHFLLPIPIWMRYNVGMPVKIMGWCHTNGSALTVGSDSEIRSFADLGAKQIAVPYWYSMHNVMLQLGLRKVGLKPVIQSQSVPLKSNEVNLFVLPPPEMPIALAGKKIDGYIVAEPFNALAELKIKAKIMRFTGDIWKNHPCCVVVMKENVVNSDKAFTQKVINAIVRAQQWIIKNRDKTANILSREGKGYLPVSEKVLLRVFNTYDLDLYGKGRIPQAIHHPHWEVKRIDFQPYPYPSATRFIFEELSNTLVEGNKSFLKKLSADFVADDLVDYTFVGNAINSLGMDRKIGELNTEKGWEREEILEI